jgi:hypothetical protein
MVIGYGVGIGAGHVRFKHPLQSVVFIAHLILGHFTSVRWAKLLRTGCSKPSVEFRQPSRYAINCLVGRFVSKLASAILVKVRGLAGLQAFQLRHKPFAFFVPIFGIHPGPLSFALHIGVGGRPNKQGQSLAQGRVERSGQSLPPTRQCLQWVESCH